MSAAKEYVGRVSGLLLQLEQLESIENTKPALRKALNEITLIEAELRQIKKQIALDMKSIRQNYAERSANAGSGGSAVFTIFGKRGSAGTWRANAKRQLAKEKENELKPYDHLKIQIDGIMIQIAKAKADIKEAIIDAV